MIVIDAVRWKASIGHRNGTPQGSRIPSFIFDGPIVLSYTDDVMRFKFNSTIPPFVVGGCVNGQIALWDLSLHHNLIDTTSSK